MKYCEMYWADIEKSVSAIPQAEKLNHRRVLVTGGTGMICSSVVDILLWLNRQRGAGIEIYLAGRSLQRTQARFPGFEEGKDYHFLPYDATTNQAPDVAVDYIIAGASNAHPAVYATLPVETILSNIVGTAALLEKATKYGARLLYISSSEVYGQKQSAEAYRETDYGYVDILNPRACYPNAKRTAETLCSAYHAEHGTDCVTVRPGHIYGPSITGQDSRASAEFTREAAAGHDIVMKSAGLQLRSYCYTLDCATAILAVLLCGECGEAYNISNEGSVVTIRGFAEELARQANCRLIFENATDAEKKAYNLMSNSALNAEKLVQLGWQARFSLQDGIASMLKLVR